VLTRPYHFCYLPKAPICQACLNQASNCFGIRTYPWTYINYNYLYMYTCLHVYNYTSILSIHDPSTISVMYIFYQRIIPTVVPMGIWMPSGYQILHAHNFYLTKLHTGWSWETISHKRTPVSCMFTLAVCMYGRLLMSNRLWYMWAKQMTLFTTLGTSSIKCFLCISKG
jgi:type IV secretory pathway VirB3-like protein